MADVHRTNGAGGAPLAPEAARPFGVADEGHYQTGQQPAALVFNPKGTLQSLAGALWARSDRMRRLLDVIGRECSAEVGEVGQVLEPLAAEIDLVAQELVRRIDEMARSAAELLPTEAGHA
ncbi:MAG: hypothetical protein EPO12_18315 [Aquabacterium sp.]|nr:MAG: hypothetical protein EPO12_18315 [Aquabacterium sp.]